MPREFGELLTENCTNFPSHLMKKLVKFSHDDNLTDEIVCIFILVKIDLFQPILQTWNRATFLRKTNDKLTGTTAISFPMQYQ